MADKPPVDAATLQAGRKMLHQLEQLPEPELAKVLLEAAESDDRTEHENVAVALFAAIVDSRKPRRDSGAATAALGTTAGLTGHTGDLYKAARVSADVHAVEKTVQTGDPKYVARRAKNKVVGRSLGKAGVWRKLWK